MNLAAFDEKWYPMLASRAIGERELGHDASAERWEELCRDFRALAEGDALDPGLLLVRVQELTDERASCDKIHRRDLARISELEAANATMAGTCDAYDEAERRVQEAERALREILDITRSPNWYAAQSQIETIAARAVLGGDVQEQETTTDSGDGGAVSSGGDS